MPTIELLLDLDDKMYSMSPKVYEMFPKVLEATRDTTCDLGLWSLNSTQAEDDISTEVEA